MMRYDTAKKETQFADVYYFNIQKKHQHPYNLITNKITK
jgi:hypothetical protein